MTNTNKSPERRAEDGRIIYDGPEDIPDFASEEEEAEWWSTHTPSDALLGAAEVMDPREAANLAEREAQKRREEVARKRGS